MNALTFHTLDFATILFSPNQRMGRNRVGRKPTGVPANSCARQEVKTASRRLSRRHEATISARVDKNVSVADIEESETARSPVVLLASI